MCAIKRSPGRLFDDKLEPGNGKAHLWYLAVFDSSVVLVRLLVGALKCPFVSNSDSFQYFATEHAKSTPSGALQEAKQCSPAIAMLDMQLASACDHAESRSTCHLYYEIRKQKQVTILRIIIIIITTV